MSFYLALERDTANGTQRRALSVQGFTMVARELSTLHEMTTQLRNNGALPRGRGCDGVQLFCAGAHPNLPFNADVALVHPLQVHLQQSTGLWRFTPLAELTDAQYARLDLEAGQRFLFLERPMTLEIVNARQQTAERAGENPIPDQPGTRQRIAQAWTNPAMSPFTDEELSRMNVGYDPEREPDRSTILVLPSSTTTAEMADLRKHLGLPPAKAVKVDRKVTDFRTRRVTRRKGD